MEKNKEFINFDEEHPCGCSLREQQVGGIHYTAMEIQPVEYIMANNLGFCEGNVVKYVSRYRFKGGKEDLLKARHYINILIDNYKD